MSSFVATLLPLVNIFLSAFEQPTVILTNLCTPTHELVKFNQRMASDFPAHPVLIRHLKNLNDLNEADAHHILVLLNLACEDIEEQITASMTKFNSNYRWLLLNNLDMSAIQERALEIFANLPILHESQIYLVANREEESYFELKRIYRNSLTTQPILEPILVGNVESYTFNWTRNSPAVAIARQQPPGLAGTLVNASLVITHNDSLNHLTDYVDKHLDTISKVNYILTNDVVAFLNATVKYSVVSSWGYLNNETGQWDGMIGELVRGDAQIGASALFFTADRVETIQYLSMTTPTKSKFVFQAPKLSFTENVFILPFGNVRIVYRNRKSW